MIGIHRRPRRAAPHKLERRPIRRWGARAAGGTMSSIVPRGATLPRAVDPFRRLRILLSITNATMKYNVPPENVVGISSECLGTVGTIAAAMIPAFVRPTSITYGSAFENCDYRAANGSAHTERPHDRRPVGESDADDRPVHLSHFTDDWGWYRMLRQRRLFNAGIETQPRFQIRGLPAASVTGPVAILRGQPPPGGRWRTPRPM